MPSQSEQLAANTRSSDFDAVLSELIQLRSEKEQTASNKESFGRVLKELLNSRDEISKEREKNARLEAVMKIKDEMQLKHEQAMEKAAQQATETQLRHEQATERALEKASLQANETQKRHELAMEQAMDKTMEQQNLSVSRRVGAGAKKEKEAEWVPPVLRQADDESKQNSNNISSSVEDDKEKARKLAAMEAELKELQKEESDVDKQVSFTLDAPKSDTYIVAADASPQEKEATRLGDLQKKEIGAVPAVTLSLSGFTRARREKWEEIAEEMYSMRSQDFTSNLLWVTRTIDKYDESFAPLLELCPNLSVILGHMLILRLGVRVQEVSWTSDMKEWSAEDCKRIGRSIATLIRWVQMGHASVDA